MGKLPFNSEGASLSTNSGSGRKHNINITGTKDLAGIEKLDR